MSKRKKIIGHFLGGILTLIFLFPSLLQFEHLFENHEHSACKESSVHFHQKNLDCSIYDFHFSVFSFLPSASENILTHIPRYSPLFYVLEDIYNNPNFHYTLRGPPSTPDFLA